MAAGGLARPGRPDEFDAGLAQLRENGEPIEGTPTGPDMRQTHRGRQYPIVTFGSRQLLVEPSRALLLFIEALVRRLAARQERPEPVMSLYITKEMRELAWYAEDGSPASVAEGE